MTDVPGDDGLRVVGADDGDIAGEERDRDLGAEDPWDGTPDGAGDSDFESLRDGFVDGFNSRDMDAILALVDADVECPDMPGSEGVGALVEELLAIWERSPGAILTRALLDGTPCAVGWLPDEDGCWSRAALVCFDAADGLLTLVAMPDDAAALDAAEVDEPTGEELDEWSDWSEWERGEETLPRDRHRQRP